MIDIKIKDFNNKLSHEHLDEEELYAQDIERLYMEIVSEMAKDYKIYKKNIATVLSILENNNTTSFKYSSRIYFKLYSKIVPQDNYKVFDLSILDNNSDVNNIITEVIYNAHRANNNKRLIDISFDIFSLSNNDKEGICSTIINAIQFLSKDIILNKDEIENISLMLPLLRQTLVSLNQSELFYHTLGIVVDRFVTSEYLQQGRNIVEEFIEASYRDNIPAMGYFESFRLYSLSGNIHTALLYGNLTLITLLNSPKPYSEKIIYEIIWQTIKFCRNIKAKELATKIHESIPINLNLKGYEKRSLVQTYFSILLSSNDIALPSKLQDFLNKERENLISGGESEITPWLIMLYNIRKFYNEEFFKNSGLSYYLSLFEQIVPASIVQRQRDIIEDNSDVLKTALKESLIKLNETRDNEDFIYDNKQSILLANKLTALSVSNSDVESFLLSMMIKSDYSIVFKDKAFEEFTEFKLPEINIDSSFALYKDKDSLIDKLGIKNDDTMLWLNHAEDKVYQLTLFNKKYEFDKVSNWNQSKYDELKKSKYFLELQFEETRKDNGQVRSLSIEEYKIQSEKILSDINILGCHIDTESKRLLIVRDMKLSDYPHNLLINLNGKFISQSIPVCNVLSTEWLLENRNSTLVGNYTKSIWNPIESGDFTLNYLHSNIEETLNRDSFKIFTTKELDSPLNSDINIICSHGADNISEKQIVFQNHTPTYNLNSVIGKGKILILFTCYSGSVKQEVFRNSITSIAKRFLSSGYEAVIAPYWALHISVPKYWLPIFLDNINNGVSISDAVFKANQKVYEIYPTPSAWACLHLYGNPNLRVNKD